MFKKVLVLLDGSSVSLEVLPAVEQLVSGTSGYELTVLTVEKPPGGTVQIASSGAVSPAADAGAASVVRRPREPAPPSYAENPGQAVQRHEAEALARLSVAARPLVDAGNNVRFAVRFGDAVREITAFAEQGDFDLIAMATHGQSGIKGIVQGSVTSAVIKSGVAPVLVVRPREGS
jgi:nucleotide-binding universal stress UspA family protein